MAPFAAAEDNLDFDLVALAQEPLGLLEPDLAVVLADAQREPDALNLNLVLLRPLLAPFFLFLVAHLAVVNDAGYRGIGERGNLNEVEPALVGHCHRLDGFDDADVLTELVNQANLLGADLSIDIVPLDLYLARSWFST